MNFPLYRQEPDTDRPRCPCCGRQVGGKLFLVSLESNRASYGSRVWRLGPGMAEFTNTLAQAWPRQVTYDTITSSVYGGDVEFDRVRNSVKTYASRLRKIVKTFGGNVRCVNRSGYQLILPTRDTQCLS